MELSSHFGEADFLVASEQLCLGDRKVKILFPQSSLVACPPTKSEEFLFVCFFLRILKVCSTVFWLSVLLLKTPEQSLFFNLHVHTL